MPIVWLKSCIRGWILRRRYPCAVLHAGAAVNPASRLGDHVVLFANAAVVDSDIGRYTYIQANSRVYNAQIGGFCSIASDVTIGLGQHPMHMVSTSPVFYDPRQPLPKFLTKECRFESVLPRTTIGPDVWIGQGAMILAGVSIGVGSVIGAGAIVTRDVPPYAIAAGVPCKVVSWRFSDETRERLMRSRWWELEDTILEHLAPLFGEPEGLLGELEQSAQARLGSCAH